MILPSRPTASNRPECEIPTDETITNETPELQALLQVDDLAWPKMCDNMAMAAADQIESVADAWPPKPATAEK